jgi:hypothetical protein
MRNLYFFLFIVLSTACKNYYLTTDSLKTQFRGIDSTRLRPVIVQGPMGGRFQYLANPIREIACVDKNGNAAQLINSPSIEMRISQADGKRSVFYFDRVLVTDSTLTGVQSRFISSIRKTIRLKDIRKIEIQDGQKDFKYISP